MMLTVLCYSAFTGLSALSWDVMSFSGFRFLTGLGVGGQFAVGVSLVAEVMPDHARPYALGWLQALSAGGNMLAAIASIVLGMMEEGGVIASAWRTMFLIGLAPAVLAIPIFLRLKEPERWKAAAQEEEIGGAGKPKLGSLSELFGDPSMEAQHDRRHVAGVLGRGRPLGDRVLQFRPDSESLRQALPGAGAQRSRGRRKAHLLERDHLTRPECRRVPGYLCVRPDYADYRAKARVRDLVRDRGGIATAITFWFLDSFWQIFVLIPIMGFCQLALFGGYSIYFPELFPTRLRSTGISFCYNVGRLVAAAGPLTLGLLTSVVFKGYPDPMPARLAGVTMCAVFLVGLIVLPFAPETKDQPLPE